MSACRRSPGPLALLPVALLAVAACGSEETGGEPGRTNVLLLVSDDQGCELGAYGRVGVRTPNLDRLAQQGCRFDAAYATTAVCTPSRAALYTGLYPVRNGCVGFTEIRPGVAVWSDRLSPAGYRTGLIGKLGGKPRSRFRFDFFGRSLPQTEGARTIDWHVRAMESFLDADDGRPFCLLVNFRDAHFPFPTDGAPTGRGGPGAEPARPIDPARVEPPPFLLDTPEVRLELARYYDSLRRLDDTVGALLALLEERGLARSTLVLFTSDNGMPFPFAKTTLYEAGIRMPLLVRWPGVVEPATRQSALVSLVDILPTLLEVAGESPPAELDGRSLVPLLRGEREVHHEAVFGSHDDHRLEPSVPARSVRVGDWKYIRNFRTQGRFENLVMKTSATWRAMLAAARDDPQLAERVRRLQFRPTEELYDLSSDPCELVDLAGESAQAPVLARLRARLRGFMESQADPLLAEWN